MRPAASWGVYCQAELNLPFPSAIFPKFAKWAWKDLLIRDETESTAADNSCSAPMLGSAFSFILACCRKAFPRWFVRPWLRCIIQRTAWKAGLQMAASLTITTSPEEHRRVKLARRRNKTGRRRTIQATILILKWLLLLSVCLIR